MRAQVSHESIPLVYIRERGERDEGMRGREMRRREQETGESFSSGNKMTSSYLMGTRQGCHQKGILKQSYALRRPERATSPQHIL